MHPRTLPQPFVFMPATCNYTWIPMQPTWLAWSRIASYYHFPTRRTPNLNKLPNGAVLVECKTLKHVVASAAEAEIAGVFHSAQTAIPIRRILRALGHTQLATPIKTDNSTASGFIHDNIQQKRSKSWDMRYHWLRDRSTQKEFNIYWAPGKNNDGDYYTKNHPTTHHRTIRNRYVLNMIRDRNTRIFHVCNNKTNFK